jgi:ankyrin repeat protein
LSYPQTKVGVKNAAKQTALKVACDKNNLIAIKLLLEHGALLSEQEKSAISDKCSSVFSEYEEKCKNLVAAVICNGKIFLQNYLQEPDNVNIRIRGCSLLHIAAARADRDMMKLLIEAGIPVDVRNAAKETPLIVACRGNKVDNVQALLKEWKADINARTGYGSSVLHVAAEHSCMDVLEYLLKYPPLMSTVATTVTELR